MDVAVTVEQIGEVDERELFLLARRRARLSQAEVAAEAGTSQAWLSSWENGVELDPERRSHVGRGPEAAALWDALRRLTERVA